MPVIVSLLAEIVDRSRVKRDPVPVAGLGARADIDALLAKLDDPAESSAARLACWFA
jgi:hypothetical protein